MKDLQLVLNPDYVELEKVIGLDLETSGLQAWESVIRLIIISTSANIYILDPTKYHKQFLTEIFQNISLCDAVIAHNAKFDCGFIYYHHGVLLRNWFCTQIGSNILTNGKIEYQGRHSLPEVIERYLGEKLEFAGAKKIFRQGKMKSVDIKKLLQKSFTSESNFDLSSFTDKQLRYATGDVKHLISLHSVLNRRIEGLQLKAIAKLENDLIPILAKMEIEGCLIDAEGWRKLIKQNWEPDLERLERELDDEVRKLLPSYGERRKTTVVQFGLFGTDAQTKLRDESCINYGSGDEILDLFRKLGEEVPTVELSENELKKNNERISTVDIGISSLFGDDLDYNATTEQTVEDQETTKDSLDESVLTTYINERPNSRMKPFIVKLIDYRVAAKRISTYGEKFLALLDENNKIHTGYTQTFTATGRLSSKAPNLQNIPAPEKGKENTNIRRFFIARPGYRLITCDMAGAEIAIAADYSQEQLLLDSIREGLDMHSLLSTVSYSIICGEPVTVSKSEIPIDVKGHKLTPVTLRDLHKSVVFAKFYKAGAKKIYGVLAEYVNMFHTEDQRIPIAQEISRALDKRMPKLAKYLTGLIDKGQKDGYLRSDKLGRIRFFSEKDYGQICNYPVQGTNANALKMAMIEIFNYLTDNKLDARMVLNVHDEILVEAHESIAEEVAKKVQEIMANALTYFLTTIKGGASYKIATCWDK